jgi:ABC-2 type transport system ATP-binding protein
MPPAIIVKGLTKKYSVPEKNTRLLSVLTRKNRELIALNHVSFTVHEGEILGYIGPNGSGKSTTIKALTGILTPTQGDVHVLGFVPWKDRYEYTKNIGVVFGQKTLLWWDIAPYECFRLYKEIYEIDEQTYRTRIDYLIQLFDIESFMHTPTRKLSLGQRMRCELVAALIPKPRVLFLDEPTIGLDVVAKQRMRDAIKEINEKEKTTVILTTHDMRDIEELASRVLILNEGKIIYEGDLEKVREKFIHVNRIEFELTKVTNKPAFASLMNGHSIQQDGKQFTLTLNKHEHSAKKILDQLFECAEIAHFEVNEPTLEEIIRDIYDVKPGKKH